ncbi:colicin immunity domain-containing protein [Buttiauxella noackiae]|uniref:Colicin D family immunity protein n=1 Tax=Buttiauxella noackiae ATCC 51607 TaxID=1354255 RepID=A0A1B7HIT5_9ENTR|nr:colicin immunity domain-containing protein [Buttiauxella noackiae]OAT15540.1 colicin D family immunity protein [Buttiauxella noackiae ATCC 51607]
MSISIYTFTKSFANERLSADEFVNAYMELWRIERDNKQLSQDNQDLSEYLSSVFCLADSYNPEDDRDDHEIDENKLREQIISMINSFESKHPKNI